MSFQFKIKFLIAFIINFSFLFTFNSINKIEAANIGDFIAEINYGEYISFASSVWRKARYYNNTTFISDEQGYFIKTYDNSYVGEYNSVASNTFSSSSLANTTLVNFYNNLIDNHKELILTTNWDSTVLFSKIGVPSLTEVINNNIVFSSPTSNWFWTRTPISGTSGLIWLARAYNSTQGGPPYDIINNYYQMHRIVPSFRLSNQLKVVGGHGTISEPYILGTFIFNLNINDSSTDIVPTKSSLEFTLSGTIDYPEDGDATNVEVSATIGGIERKVDIAVSENMTWQLSWNYNDLSEGEYTDIEFAAASNSSTPEETTNTYTGKIIIDKTAPTCGTWTPSESTWKVSGGETFTLTSSTDVGGSGLTTASASVSCATGPLHGDTCPVSVYDNAGNDRICTSPINKVDIFPPTLTVTPAITGWQGDKQDIIVTSSDEQTSLSRIAYAWDLNTLGSDCSGGTSISSGDNLRLTISGGANPLYVCSIDLAGNVANFTNIYQYTPPVFANPTVDKNVKPSNLYWNIQSVSETSSYIEVKGFFPKTTGNYNYALEYIIPTISKSYTQALRTSPFAETHFTILIPTTDFNASKDNHTFSGPQKLKITDLDQMEATTIDHNLSFFFPIHQTNHRTSINYFIFASDNRLNEIE